MQTWSEVWESISPLLSCISYEILSQSLTLAYNHGLIKPIHVNRGMAFSTHALCTHDIMIFFRETRESYRISLRTLKDYGAESGQIINVDKSKFKVEAMFL